MLNIFGPKDELDSRAIKQCPHCKGFVKGNDVKCRHCKKVIQQKKPDSISSKNKENEAALEEERFSI